MAERLPLTASAHEAIAAAVHAGDSVIDATAGNGHDTLFLAQQVGAGGRVFAFDIQETAIDGTRRRLAASGLADRVALFRLDHRRFDEVVPASLEKHIAAVMFNLGYRPGGDKRLTTRPETTLEALGKSIRWLRPGGVLTVIAYPAHEGGGAERDAVRTWMDGREGLQPSSPLKSDDPASPVLFVAKKADPRSPAGPIR